MPRKKRSADDQLKLLEARVKTAPCVPAIRKAVAEWRAANYKGATDTTKLLLNYWFKTDQRLPDGQRFAFYDAQREAVETLIYLHEVARVRWHKDLLERFSPEQFGFSIEYTDSVGNLRYYEPDFMAVLTDGTHYLIETKGREDPDVSHKDRAARLWCENAALLTRTDWAYLKVLQAEFEKLLPTEFSDLLIFAP